MNSFLIPIFLFSIFTFCIGIILIPIYISILQHYKLGKQIREEATIGKATEFSKLHKNKVGTPTLWGVIILVLVFDMVLASIFLQKLGMINNSLFNQQETYLSLFTLFFVGILWGVDDVLNIFGKWRTKWLSARIKILWLTIFAGIGSWWFYEKLNFSQRTMDIPFFDAILLWAWFIPVFILIIVATANSVNITDGLDGLAPGLLLFAYGVYAYITYDQGMYLLSTLCVTIIGALVAFLWYNVKPAKLYMGDIWSLALWANLWIMAMLTDTIIVLLMVGSIFIFETISVIIQLLSKKLRKGKKVFRIAPFHHHLEAIGRSEENVVFRFWLLGIICSAIAIIVYNI